MSPNPAFDRSMVKRTSLLFLGVALCSTPVASTAADVPPLLCRNILAIASRDLLLMGILRPFDSVLIEGDKICGSEGYEPGLITCDWDYSIKEVGVLQPGAGTELRMVQVVRNHLTGSGASSAFVAFQCQEGRIAQTFSREFTYGGHFETLSVTAFALTAGYWLPKDPMCCPSYHKRMVYRWDASTKKYALVEESFSRYNNKTNTDEPVDKPSETVPWNP